MIQLSQLTPHDIVLEVGAGKGALTINLIKKAGEVLIVEKDPSLFETLKNLFSNNSNVKLFLGDILQLDLPRYNKIVSSLPYSISARFFLWLLDKNFEIATLLLQREFADKLKSPPGSSKYGRLSVLTGSAFTIQVHDSVSPSSFVPQPKVFSSIVTVNRKKNRKISERFFIDFVTALFSQRRRKLKAVVKSYIDKRFRGIVFTSIEDFRIPDKRVFETSVEEFERLASLLVLKLAK